MSPSSSNLWKLAAYLPVAAAAISANAQSPAYLLADAAPDATGIWTFHHDHILGTSLELSVRASSLAAAEQAEAAALATFRHDDAHLSTWRADSEVSRWARTHLQPIAVSPQLYDVLAAFDTWRQRTSGALDASVEAATRLWQSTTAQGRVPTDREIALAVEAMQQPHWSLDPAHRTATRVSDVPLALASFTKSYISSRAADAALHAELLASCSTSAVTSSSAATSPSSSPSPIHKPLRKILPRSNTSSSVTAPSPPAAPTAAASNSRRPRAHGLRSFPT
jgi:thiamine biosynthesis lipoprotein